MADLGAIARGGTVGTSGAGAITAGGAGGITLATRLALLGEMLSPLVMVTLDAQALPNIRTLVFAWDNKADAATVTASAQIDTLPASNVQHQDIARKWRAPFGVRIASLLFDMGVPVTCGQLGVIGSSLGPLSTLRLRASSVDPTALTSTLLDTGTLSAGAKAGYPAAYKTFNDVSARWWLLDLENPPSSFGGGFFGGGGLFGLLQNTLSVGRVYLGPKWVLPVNYSYGWGITAIDPSEVTESHGGQEAADVRAQRRQLNLTLEWMTESDAFSQALAMARSKGIVGDVLAVPDPGGDHVPEQSVWGRMTAPEPIFNRLTRTWAQKYTIRERL